MYSGTAMPPTRADVLHPAHRRVWGIQFRQRGASLGQLAAHAQALEEVDSLGEGCAGGGEVAAQSVEAGNALL